MGRDGRHVMVLSDLKEKVWAFLVCQEAKRGWWLWLSGGFELFLLMHFGQLAFELGLGWAWIGFLSKCKQFPI